VLKRYLMVVGIILAALVGLGVWLKPPLDKMREGVEAGLSAYARNHLKPGETMPSRTGLSRSCRRRGCTRSPSGQVAALADLQVHGRHFAGAFVSLFLERHFLAVVEATQAGSFNGADVDENVLAAVIRLDEAVAFGGVEPFNSTGSHFWGLPCSMRDDVRANAVRLDHQA
jgi:hypothetical protein